MVPSYKKFMKFENLKNYIKRNWLIQSDFECIIDDDKEHKFISGVIMFNAKMIFIVKIFKRFII